MFRESYELDGGLLMLKGTASRDPKDDIKGISLTFVLEKRGRRWYVKRMEPEMEDFSQ